MIEREQSENIEEMKSWWGGDLPKTTETLWYLTDEGYIKAAREFAKKYDWKETGLAAGCRRLSFKKEKYTLLIWYGTRNVKITKLIGKEVRRAVRIKACDRMEVLEEFFKQSFL